MTSTRSIRRRASLAAITAGMLVLAACGGSSDTPAAPAPAPAPAPASPEAPAGPPFYEGKTIELIVPFATGGGTDTTARLLAPFLEKYIEGNPTIQVVNVPGGGSVNGANQYALQGPRDGSQILFTALSTTIPWLIGAPEVRYDLADFNLIAGFPGSRAIWARTDSGIETAVDLGNPPSPLIFGGTEPTGAELTHILAMQALGLRGSANIREVWGYDSGDAALAFQTGETQIGTGTTATYLRSITPLVEQGIAIPLFTYGMVFPDGTVLPDEALPDVPTVADVYRGIYNAEPSGEAWDAFVTFQSIFSAATFGMWLFQDAPVEALNALRAALVELAQDPEFLAARDKAVGPYTTVTGDDAQAFADSLRQISPSSLSYVRNILRDEYGIEGLRD